MATQIKALRSRDLQDLEGGFGGGGAYGGGGGGGGQFLGRLNKPAQDNYTYRSPNQTNAKDLTPNLRENVVSSQRADSARIQKGLEAPAARANNRTTQQEAGGRAITRTAARAGLTAAALEGGLEAGEKLNEATGASKKLAGLAEKTSRGKSESNEDDTDTANRKEVARVLREVDADAAERKNYTGNKKGGVIKKMASGGVTASKRADGIAQRGKTRGKMC